MEGLDLHSVEELEKLQALPLEQKIRITVTRIIEWYQHYNGMVYTVCYAGWSGWFI